MIEKHHRRIRWKVRRCPDGWLPTILIGEERVTLSVVIDKNLARKQARSRAKELRNAGNG